MTYTHIIGVGKAVPSAILDNAQVAKRFQVSEEWILSRAGIRERRVAAPEEDTFHDGSWC